MLVDVEDLTVEERRQILYNHIELGDQPAKVKTKMKPFLDNGAAAQPFRPEMARRLGLRAFTAGLSLTQTGITKFMTYPRQFLRDVYEQLGADQQAALALVYAAAVGGSLENPLTLNEAQRDIIDRAGSSPAGAVRALESLTGSFLQVTGPPLAKPGWAFRHPTLWEGFASWVSTQAHLLNVVLAGLSDNALLTRIDCEDETADETHGTLLRVPPALYLAVATRLAAIRPRPWEGGMRMPSELFWERHRRREAVVLFLARRSSDPFLRVYLDADPDLPGSLVDFYSYVYAAPEPNLLARLHQLGLLNEEVRRRAVERMKHLAVTTPDDGWLRGTAWKILLTPQERATLVETVREEVVPRLKTGYAWRDHQRYEYDDTVERVLRGYEIAFKKRGDLETAEAFAAAREMYSQLSTVTEADEEDRAPLTDTELAPSPDGGRSIFDDIDEE